MITKNKQAENLSYKEMERAIIKINRRIDELTKFDINSILKTDDAVLQSLEHKLNELLLDIFGNRTTKYFNYKDTATLYVPSLAVGIKPNINEERIKIKKRIDAAIIILNTIKSGFMEELADAGIGGSAAKAIKAYEGLELHPDIAKAANNLYLDGHYANAIEDSVKALNALVRLKSGITNKDGVELMQHVFSTKNPILKFNQLTDESDRNEQKGFMDMFTGAVTGLRNPRAHKIIQDDPEMALEFIAFISLLAKLTDKVGNKIPQ